MAEEKNPPVLVIQTPQDVNKLVGWRVDKATVTTQPLALVLEISHVAAPNRVLLRIIPTATLKLSPHIQLGGGQPVLIEPVIQLMTADIKEA